MLEHSPYSSPHPGHCLDFELGLSLDDCPIQIRPERTAHTAAVHWAYLHCGHTQRQIAPTTSSPESLVAVAKGQAMEHIMRAHPGPETLAFFESF